MRPPRSSVRPLIYAHRGASADAAENTLEAFALAKEQGADGVELDVRRSADGALVLHHDPTLPDGRVVAHTPQHELPATVPTLAEALDVCAGLRVNIELKNIRFEPDHDPACRIADDVVALLQARPGRDRVLVSSFDLRTIDRVKALEGSVATGFLTFVDPAGPASVELAARRGHDAVHPHEWSIETAFVALAHDLGLEVNVWTVDDPDRIRRLAGHGVDGVITNVPAIAREALAAAPG